MSDNATIRTLREVEDEHIVKVFRELDGNMTATAQALGIDRRTLHRRAKSLALGRGRGRAGPSPSARELLERRVAELEERLAKHEGTGAR